MKPCAGCQRPISHGLRWCKICRSQHWGCAKSKRKKPPGTRCPACRIEYNERYLAKPGRRCPICSQPAEPRGVYCTQCRLDNQAYDRAKRRRQQHLCGLCNEPLRPGSLNHYHRRCELQQWIRYCGICGRWLTASERYHYRCNRCRRDVIRIDKVLKEKGILTGPPEKMPTGPRWGWVRGPNPPRNQHYER